jgi:predicted kinase
MKAAVKQMAEDVVNATEAGKDIIWDQTSTTVSTRAKKIKMLEGYTKIAVVFNTPKFDELNDRLQKRALTGKVIPSDVMHRMISGFEHPTLEEGFDQIWHAC